MSLHSFADVLKNHIIHIELVPSISPDCVGDLIADAGDDSTLIGQGYYTCEIEVVEGDITDTIYFTPLAE